MAAVSDNSPGATTAAKLCQEVKVMAPWCGCAKCTHWLGFGSPCNVGCLQLLASFDEEDYFYYHSVAELEQIISQAKERRAAGVKPYNPAPWIRDSVCAIL